MEIPDDIADSYSKLIQVNLKMGRLDLAHRNVDRAMEDAIDRANRKVDRNTYLDLILDSDQACRLSGHGIETVGDLVSTSYTLLMLLPGISNESIELAAKVVRNYGYVVKHDPMGEIDE